MARNNSDGRLDYFIEQLEKLHKDSHQIFDTYVDDFRSRNLSLPFGAVKQHEIIAPAGTGLDYVAALKLLKLKLRTPNAA